MRTCLFVIIINLCSVGILQAQTTDSTVTGYLFDKNGSLATLAQVHVISVIKSGSSSMLTPMALSTDANGFTSFTVPRLSTIWIVATALGLNASGDVAILIPDADFATLAILAQSARPAVLGFSLSSGSNPILSLSLEDFGINLNAGATPPPTTAETFNDGIGVVVKASSSTGSNVNPLEAAARILDAPAAPTAQDDIVTTGSYRFQFPATTGYNAQWLSAETPGDTNAADVNLAISSSLNTGSPRNNIVTSWGYNNNGDGIRVNAAEPSLNYRFETFYSPSPGKEYMESHLQYQSTRGKLLRPFAYLIDRNTDVSSVHIQTDAFSYLGPDETQYVKFMPHGVYFLNRTSLVSYVNGHQFLQQLNAAGTYFVNLAHLDGADRVQLGGGAASTDVVVSGGNLYVGGNGGVKVTSVDAAGLALTRSNGSGAFLAGTKLVADPASPPAGGWKLYGKDDGTGKTQLCVLFSSGAPQCFARQP
jgi:hypothetical protein